MSSNEVPTLIFADGACSGNPGPGGWGAIVLRGHREVTELGGARSPTTNNQMEILASIAALADIDGEPGLAVLHTDSQYLINGITKWIFGWQKNGWKTKEGKEVANAELWRKLALLTRDRKGRLEWVYVPGHSGVPGNERADQIAVAYSRGQRPALYQGPLMGYGVDLHRVEPGQYEKKPKSPSSSSSKKAPAYSYLSLVDGKLMRHATWPECEARVKGRPSAKFRKSTSAIDETEILRSWGCRPEDLSKS